MSSDNEEKEIQARPYQLRLVEYLTEHNGIVYLPTGSGKTYVAILTLKRFSHDFDKPIEEGGKRAFFFCNTVALAQQQSIVLKKMTNFKVGLYIGVMGTDDWKRGKWEDEIRDHQVLVGTAQVFLDMFTQNFMSLTSVSIVVIDECHHGTGSHPYHEFAKLVAMQMSAGRKPLPRIVGLTGVLIKGNEIKGIPQKLREIENTYGGNIVTIADSDELQNVMLYSTKPRECMIPYRPMVLKFAIVEDIRRRIENFFVMLDLIDIGKQPVRLSKGLNSEREPNKKSAVKALLKDFLFQVDNYGIYVGSISILSVLVEFEVKRKQAETHSLRNMYRAVITLCENIRHSLNGKLRDMLDDDSLPDDAINSEETILNFSTPKIQLLLQYLKKAFANKQREDIRCLIFAERRFTCKCIYGLLLNYIAACPELRHVLFPQFMVGRNSGIVLDFEHKLEESWRVSAIQDFREGKANVMVCSSVLEEGIDVQACNYVIVLDPIKTFNMYVQTKGRARSKDSQFVLVVSDMEKSKTSIQISQYRQAHEDIRRYLQERVLDKADPLLHDIKDHFQSEIPPFINGSNAVLLPSSSLSILNRYCQQIHPDAFGVVLPWFRILDQLQHEQYINPNSRKFRVSVTLPLSSKLRETIISNPMSCPRSAKISAAFKACIKLYELGELNERFLPTTSKDRVAEIADVHFEHWKKYNDDVRSKRKDHDVITKTYTTQYPTVLNNAMPQIGAVCYAYEILYEPIFERNDYTSHIYDALQKGGSFALLLRNRLPRLAEMPLFGHQGQINVRVAEQPVQLTIESQEQLEQLKRFHVMIFRDLLRIWQPFFLFDNYSGQNSFLVVPLSATPKIGIDWPLVGQFQQLSKASPISLAERRRMGPPKPEDYENVVVTQWYANYDMKRMLVTKVRTDLTPSSNMEDGLKHTTYSNFTMSKYANDIGDIVHKQQFILEVRELSDQLNFYVQQRMKTSAQSKARSKVMLIPELCFNYRFPGHLWVKAVYLPSILRRVHYMLHAEIIRVRFNKYLGLDTLPLNSVDYRPKRLEIDYSLRRNVDREGNAICEDACDEPRSLLEPLPTKGIEMAMEKLDIIDLEVPWQKYMEPIDIDRNLLKTFPVELSYYCNFTSGRFFNSDDMEKNAKDFWDLSQLRMPEGNIYNSQGKSNNNSALMITDGDKTKRSHDVQLSVLQRSISNGHITPAEQSEYLAAITTSGSVDVFDMERFELLGDCFLKMGATLYLANKYGDWNEGILTQVKSELVSNRNLLYCLSETDIPSRICSTIFTPKYNWLPPSVGLPKNVVELWEKSPSFAARIGPHNLRDLSISDVELFGNGYCEEKEFNSFIESFESNKPIPNYGTVDYSSEINFCVGKVQMADKLVADTLEALLGVVVKNYGLQHGFRMLEYFGICKPDIGKPLTQLLDLQLGGAHMRTNISQREVDGYLVNYRDLERNLGYSFRDRAYLLQALTHPSNPTNRITGGYQELEFVGDAILDFLISAYIFEHKTRMTPGQLTDLRSALVNNTTLACICVRHRFHFFILAENALLSESIQNFVKFQESQNHRVTSHVRILMEEADLQPQPLDSDDELETLKEPSCQGPPDNDANAPKIGSFNISHNVDVPKALGDVLEAIIAAVYLDCRDLNTTWKVVYRMFEPEITEFSRNVPINPIRQLYEHNLANPTFGPPVVDKNKVMVSCQFICMDKTLKVYGFGNNGKQAKLSAAKHALQMLAKSEA